MPEIQKFFFGIAVGSLFLFLVMVKNGAAGTHDTAVSGLPLEHLSEAQIQKVRAILTKLEPMIKAREAREDLATLNFDELYAPLMESERVFVRQFQKFDPIKAGLETTWHGIADGQIELTAVQKQTFRKKGLPTVLPTQYVPTEVYHAYQVMMQAMEKDIGKKLYIESGYRSSAYQLYLFISYLQKHEYSVRETAHWNAFPGYSEHGDPKNQALDFINEEGISGENNPEAFAVLPEYRWLFQHAASYRFKLSFPKKNPKGIGFEPWHWHYTGNQE